MPYHGFLSVDRFFARPSEKTIDKRRKVPCCRRQKLRFTYVPIIIAPGQIADKFDVYWQSHVNVLIEGFGEAKPPEIAYIGVGRRPARSQR